MYRLNNEKDITTSIAGDIEHLLCNECTSLLFVLSDSSLAKRVSLKSAQQL